jgi:hypothetical protein
MSQGRPLGWAKNASDPTPPGIKPTTTVITDRDKA